MVTPEEWGHLTQGCGNISVPDKLQPTKGLHQIHDQVSKPQLAMTSHEWYIMINILTTSVSGISAGDRSNPPFHSYKGFQAIPEPPMPTATGGRQRLLGELNKLIFVNHYNSAWHIVMAIKVLGNKYTKIINIFINKNDLWGTEYSWGVISCFPVTKPLL